MGRARGRDVCDSGVFVDGEDTEEPDTIRDNNVAGHSKFVHELDDFNRKFFYKTSDAYSWLEDTVEHSEGKPLKLGSNYFHPRYMGAKRSLYMNVAIVYETPGNATIAVRRGGHVVSTVELRKQGDISESVVGSPLYACFLDTLSLRRSVSHPFKVKANDDRYFHKRGFGTLAVAFGLLYTVRMGMRQEIACVNEVTALILYRMFGIHFEECDVEVDCDYQAIMMAMSGSGSGSTSTSASVRGRGSGGGGSGGGSGSGSGSDRGSEGGGGGCGSASASGHGSGTGSSDSGTGPLLARDAFLNIMRTRFQNGITYMVSPTATNAACIVSFIEEWQHEHVTALEFPEFAKRYFEGPRVQDEDLIDAHSPHAHKMFALIQRVNAACVAKLQDVAGERACSPQDAVNVGIFQNCDSVVNVEVRKGFCGRVVSAVRLDARVGRPFKVAHDACVDHCERSACGALALGLALLYGAHARARVEVVCASDVTALVMYRIFGTEFAPGEVDVRCGGVYDYAAGLRSAHAACPTDAQGRALPTPAFLAFFADVARSGSRATYVVHPTGANIARLAAFVDTWTAEHVTGADSREFVQRFHELSAAQDAQDAQDCVFKRRR